MKTIAQSLTVSVAIYTVLFLLIASVAFGSELNLNNNSKVVPPEIVFEDEAYIDDIPFDTQAIAEAYLLDETMKVEFDFEEEAYVDDIPFNTNEVVKNYKTEEYLKNICDFEEETYVDDIPFDTEKIASEVFFIYYYAK